MFCGIHGMNPATKQKRGKPMIATMKNLFLTHPQSVDESYLEHMAFAGRFSVTLFLAAGAALVHAFLPFLFEKTASRMIAEMYARTKNRGR
jgi:hypothetical protein